MTDIKSQFIIRIGKTILLSTYKQTNHYNRILRVVSDRLCNGNFQNCTTVKGYCNQYPPRTAFLKKSSICLIKAILLSHAIYNMVLCYAKVID